MDLDLNGAKTVGAFSYHCRDLTKYIATMNLRKISSEHAKSMVRKGYGMKNSKPMKLQNWQEMYIAQSRCLSGEIPIFLHIKKCLIISKVKRKDGKQV